MEKKLLTTFILVAMAFASASPTLAAIGCTLTNPAQDLKFLYPEVTSFKEEVKEFRMFSDGQVLYEKLRSRLGGDLDPVYESYDTPFTVYRVFNGNDLIGIVHGVNIPGSGGVIQLFLATDPSSGQIRQFFFQRLESQISRYLRQKVFRESFKELTLADFYMNDYFKAVDPENLADKLGKIKPAIPDGVDGSDYRATLRGLRKNLILLDFFVYDRMNEKFHLRAQELLNTKQLGKEN
ncbi:MAG: hypothetical protein ACOYXC_03035 [Candidatus Rifleibacteriota bacterium]